jgi:hypothetical protein
LGKYSLQVLVDRDRIQFADKQYVFRRRDFGEGEIPNHFECKCMGPRFTLPPHTLKSFGVIFFLERLIPCDTNCSKLRGRREGTLGRLHEPSWVFVWVVKHDGVKNTDVFEWLTFVVYVCCVYLLQRIEALHDCSKDSSLAVQKINILSKSDDELAASIPLLWIVWRRCSGHTDGAHLFML